MNPLGTMKEPQLCLYLIPILLNMELNYIDFEWTETIQLK